MSQIPPALAVKNIPQPIFLMCPHCGHEWRYRGKITVYSVTCPECRRSFPLPEKYRKILPRKQLKQFVELKCKNKDCVYHSTPWRYTGKHVEFLKKKNRASVWITCPACYTRQPF